MIGRKDSEGIAAKGSEANEKHIIGNWKKGKSCYVVAESLAELCPSVLWKAWLVTNELGWIFFWGDSQAKWLKMWLGFSWLLPVKCKRKDLRIREELNKKGSRTWWSGIFLAIQIAKDTKVRSITFKKKCSGYKANSIADHLCLMTPKAQKVWVFSHRDVSLRRIGMWFMDPLNLVSRTQI